MKKKNLKAGKRAPELKRGKPVRVQRVVMARLLYETEKRACDKTDGEVWMAYPTWKKVSTDMKKYYAVVARNFSRSILKRHNND